jgi:hypothetical protein
MAFLSSNCSPPTFTRLLGVGGMWIGGVFPVPTSGPCLQGRHPDILDDRRPISTGRLYAGWKLSTVATFSKDSSGELAHGFENDPDSRGSSGPASDQISKTKRGRVEGGKTVSARCVDASRANSGNWRT